MNIRIFKQNMAMLCISMVLAASLQPALADNILPDPALLYETELSLLADPDLPDEVSTLTGTVHQGGPFTMRTFFLTIPVEGGESEFLVASYAWTGTGDEVQVTINAGGEIYNFINFLKSREEVDGFIDRYLELYHRYYGGGSDGAPDIPAKPGWTVADRMMHFFTWLDGQLLISEDREYGFARKFAWMRSEAYQQFFPHAAGLLHQVSYAAESEVDNAWVKSLTFQDLVVVFDYPIKRVLDQEIPMPGRNEMESFSLGLLAMETDQPQGSGGGWDWGFNDYYDCWNQTWSGMACLHCCGDWYTFATAICSGLFLINPAAAMACYLTAATGYMYCRLGCSLANPSIEEGWSGGA
jgi:hypothetical protein